MLASAAIWSIAKLVAEACIFIFFVLVSRAYGPEGLGRYSLATAVGSLILILAQGGTYTLSLKEIPRKGASVRQYVEQLLGLRILLALLASCVLLIGAAWPVLSSGDRILWILIGAFQIVSALIIGSTAVLVAMGRVLQAGALEILQKMLIALGGGALVLWGATLEISALALPILSAVVFVIGIKLERNVSGARHIRFEREFSRKQFVLARPYLVVDFLDQVARRADIILIGMLLGTLATGQFNAAYRIRFLIGLIMAQVRDALLPAISRSAVESPEQMRQKFHNVMGAILLIAIPAFAGLFILANEIIDSIFGAAYEQSAILLVVLAGSIPPLCVRQVASVFLQALGKESYWSRTSRIVALFAVASAALGIWLFGTVGAAAAIVLTEFLAAALFLAPLVKLFGWRPSVERLAVGFVGSVLMGAFLYQVPTFAMPVKVLTGAMVYGLFMFTIPGIRRVEFAALREAFRK
jgi:O-antigen/teichoic acid export membrane protein